MAIMMRLSRMKKRRPIGRRFSHFQGDSLEERSLGSPICSALRNGIQPPLYRGWASNPNRQIAPVRSECRE